MTDAPPRTTPVTTPLVAPDAPPLCGDGLDRLACRRRDEAWLARAWSRARVLAVVDGRVPVACDGGTLLLRDSAEFGPAEVPEGSERYFLGVDADGVPYFAVDLPSVPEWAGVRFVTLRDLGDGLSAVHASLVATTLGLHHWHARHAYSPRTGRPTRAGEAGWVRVTDQWPPGTGADQGSPGTGLVTGSSGTGAVTGSSGGGPETMWPRTDPAVIVLVHDGVPVERGGRCLLASNVAWPPAGGLPRYSCLAGFVEPGESAEQAIVREIAEEVGVTVTHPRYVASQPWPLPGSLMLGFSALADPHAELKLDPEEISDARWFTRAEVAEALAGRSTEIAVPLGVSIACFLLTHWAAGSLPLAS